jgi:putative intracellular protease/amidase
MSRCPLYASLAAILCSSAPAFAIGNEAPKVLLFVRDGSREPELMLTEEVGVMKRMLEASGFEVDVATESGEPMRAGSAELVSNLRIRDAVASKYDGIALPCMAPGAEHAVSPEALAIVKAFVTEGKPILAARGSVAVLAQAGGLEGKKYAFASEVDLKKQPAFAGGHYQGTGVVRDGNVSTSGVCPLSAKTSPVPDGTEEVTRNFIESLKAKN